MCGYFAYHAVPTNARKITSFHHFVVWHWRRALSRRSHKAAVSWVPMGRIAARWLPSARISHPWPQRRFLVKYPRWEPSAFVADARICPGAQGETCVPTRMAFKSLILNNYDFWPPFRQFAACHCRRSLSRLSAPWWVPSSRRLAKLKTRWIAGSRRLASPHRWPEGHRSDLRSRRGQQAAKGGGKIDCFLLVALTVEAAIAGPTVGGDGKRFFGVGGDEAL